MYSLLADVDELHISTYCRVMNTRFSRPRYPCNGMCDCAPSCVRSCQGDVHTEYARWLIAVALSMRTPLTDEPSWTELVESADVITEAGDVITPAGDVITAPVNVAGPVSPDRASH